MKKLQYLVAALCLVSFVPSCSGKKPVEEKKSDKAKALQEDE